MQVNKIGQQKKIRQGTIFSISGIKVPKSERSKKLIQFKNMYPEVDLKGVTYGIVLSQTCDLVETENRSIKIPYINISLVEPIDRFISDDYKDKIEKIFNKHSFDYSIKSHKIKITNRDSIIHGFKKSFNSIFQNNEKYLYFLVLPWRQKSRMFVVNLTKSFPLKSQHSRLIQEASKFQLEPFFESSLGWKMVDLYGRVGTPDYKDKELSILSKNLLKRVLKAAKDNNERLELSAEEFEKIKATRNATVKEKTDTFIKVMFGSSLDKMK